ncbi:MAG: hypothetical protein ACOYWZ_08795 [Bacillota bacterium]
MDEILNVSCPKCNKGKVVKKYWGGNGGTIEYRYVCSQKCGYMELKEEKINERGTDNQSVK